MKLKILLLFAVNFICISTAYAVEEKISISSSGYSWEAFKVFLSLVVVLGIFYLLVNLFRKHMGINLKTNSSIRILGGLSLGNKEKVVLLEAGEINLLVGVSSAGITKLHKFSENELLNEKQTNDIENQDVSLPFKNQIEKILKIK